MSPVKRPVVVLQHHVDVGPGYFTDWLQSQRIAYDIVRIDGGEAVPGNATDFAGICSLGGPMSANDPLPWIAAELRLLNDAVDKGVPVIGHCLGGQLLARSRGAAVTRNPVKEIGWGTVTIVHPELAWQWLGETGAEVEMFQWHGDAFALPAGAVNFLSSPYCKHQGFVLEHAGVAHLGMQFHCEATAGIVRNWTGDDTWYEEVAAERAATGGPAVQDAQAMRADLEARCAQMHRFAARLYARWAQGMAPPREADRRRIARAESVPSSN